MNQFYNILESGKTVKTLWDRQVGDRVESSKVKYSLTELEYNQCLENSKEIVKKYFDKKNFMISKGFGFSDDAKQTILKSIYDEIKDEPLMQESFFISMPNFN